VIDSSRVNPSPLLMGLVDFSRLTGEIVGRLQEIVRKHGVLPSIETLEGLLIFPNLLANGSPDSRESGKNRAFSPQSKCYTHSATEKSTSP
jgi:hypothetical protein